MFRGIVKGTGYPLHPPVSPSFPLPCVTVCHHISTGLHLKAPAIFSEAHSQCAHAPSLCYIHFEALPPNFTYVCCVMFSPS